MIKKINKVFLSAMAMFLSCSLPLCAQDDYNPDFPADPGDTTQILQYTVSVDVNDASMGYVSGAGKFKYGRSVAISTSAVSGYEFVQWLKDGAEYSTSKSFTYTVTANVKFTAVYKEKETSGSDSGSEESGSGTDSDKDSGSTEADAPAYDPSYSPDFPGDPVTPNIPDEEEKDDSGDDSDSGTGSEQEVTTVYHKLYLVPSPAGSCTFDKESGAQIAEDEAFSVTAVPGTDMTFEGWYQNSTKVSSNLTYSTFMGKSNMTLTAMFEYVPSFPTDPSSSLPNVIKGDINNDGKVNVTDVVALINRIQAGTAAQLDPNIADMNSDGNVNITDAVALTTYCQQEK